MTKFSAFLEENIGRQVTLQEMAVYARMSKYHFIRVFRQRTGFTPADFFLRQKIQKACGLLETSDMKIQEISALLGFGSPYYFSAVFRRVMGQAPVFYRERMQGWSGRH